jgi:hypothetical protein
MDMSEWVGLIGALAGTAIGGYVTYKVTKAQHSHENKQEAHRKYISVCEAVHEMLSSISGHSNQLNMMVIGDLGYDSPFDAKQLQEKIQLDRLKMLVGFYTPEINDEVKRISEKLTIIVRSVTEVILVKERTPEWKSKTVESSAIATIELGNIVKEAQEKLAKLVNQRMAAEE